MKQGRPRLTTVKGLDQFNTMLWFNIYPGWKLQQRMSSPCPVPRSTSRSSTQTQQRLQQPQNHHHRRPQVKGRTLQAWVAETAILQSSLFSWLFYLWGHEIYLPFQFISQTKRENAPSWYFYTFDGTEYTRMKTTSLVICHIHLRNSNEWQDSKSTHGKIEWNNKGTQTQRLTT